MLSYQLTQGANIIGTRDGSGGVTPDVVLGGLGLVPHHATLTRNGDELELECASDARTVVNGSVLRSSSMGRPIASASGTVVLQHNDRVIFGNNNVLRVVIPSRRDACPLRDDEVDWQFAMNEVRGRDKARVSDWHGQPSATPTRPLR